MQKHDTDTTEQLNKAKQTNEQQRSEKVYRMIENSILKCSNNMLQSTFYSRFFIYTLKFYLVPHISHYNHHQI